MKVDVEVPSSKSLLTEYEAVIVGAGPTGMMLAAELTLAKIDVVVIERRTNSEIDGSRAGGLHARTIELLDQRGVAGRFLSEGQQHPFVGYAGTFLDISDFPTRHNYLLALWQSDFERILADWLDELGVPVFRGREVVGLAQDDAGVNVELSDGQSVRTRYLVGCDGGRSLVRKAAGIGFPGWDPTASYLIAEVEMNEEPEIGMRPEGGGIGPVDRENGGGPYRVVLLEEQVDGVGTPTINEVKDALIDAYGTDYGVHSPTWISRFNDASRQADAYRKERLMLAGDAAHIHGPAGGQGLNTGVQDAVNLGWKLAQVIKNTSPESLLDTYHLERHPVGARVLQNTMAQVALARTDQRSKSLREAMLDLLSMDEPRIGVAAMISGLDIRYDLGEGHPLLGRRMPDLDLSTSEGPRRVFELLNEAQPILLHFGKSGDVDLTPWTDRILSIEVGYRGVWELPVVGEVPAPTSVLIRPDGYVAWVGEADSSGLVESLNQWFGSATDEMSTT